MKATSKRSNKVKELFYSTLRGNEATQYGTEKEVITQQEYVMHQKRMGHPGLTVDTAGLFVNPENPWLAASPDGLVHDPITASHPQGLVEIKNPTACETSPLKRPVQPPTSA